MQTLISQYRQADVGELFQASRPGPKRQPKKDAARERALELRRSRHGIEEIVSELARAGTPLSRTAVWEILREEGLSRMPQLRQDKPEPAPERLAAEKVRVLAEEDWPTRGQVQTQHAGLFLLVPELVALDLPGLIDAAGWPSTSQLPAIRSVLSLLALKLSGRRRRSHVRSVVHDPALGAFAGLNVLPKTWHLTTYSYRTSRSQQVAFFEALQPRLREAGLIGEQGVNLDFHAIMSYGEQDTVLEKHYVPRRSQRTRSVLTFIAQDGQQHTILYANAELTSRQQAGEVTDFCRFYERRHGQLPKLLVFDGKLTTNEHLAELDQMGVGFITLRQRYPKLIAVARGSPGQRLDQDPAGPLRQAQDRQLPRRRRHDQRQRLPPARRPARPRSADPDPHQPTAAHSQAADRTLRPTLGHREPTRRADPRVPPRLALLPGPARRRLRRLAHSPRRHHLPTVRPRPAHRLPQPNPRHDPRLPDRRDRRAALHPRPHRGRATPPHPHPSTTRRRLPEPPVRFPGGAAAPSATPSPPDNTQPNYRTDNPG